MCLKYNILKRSVFVWRIEIKINKKENECFRFSIFFNNTACFGMILGLGGVGCV